MKKSYLMVLLVAVGFGFSCKKDHKESNSQTEKTYPITFSIADFAQTVTPLGADNKATNAVKTNVTALPLGSVIDVLGFVIYSNASTNSTASKDVFVARSVQNSVDAGFGTLSQNLPAGDYTVVAVGGKTGLNVFDGVIPTSIYSRLNNTFGYTSVNSSSTYVYSPWEDTFYGKTSFTVGAAATNQQISLSRTVGQLVINIEDALPADISKISLSVGNEISYSYIDQNANKDYAQIKPYASTTTVNVPASAIGTTNYQVSMIVGNTGAALNVEVKCYNSAGVVIANKSNTTATCVANKRTILSGKLFSGGGIKVGTIAPWLPDGEIIHF